jgi:hypothetical protein
MTMVAGISLILSLEAVASARLSLALAAYCRQFLLQRDDLFAQLKYDCRTRDIHAEVVNQSLSAHEAIQVCL